ncbi:MAG: hypothetical protein WA376_21875, partial [Terrimicrobiaceae bacterium]
SAGHAAQLLACKQTAPPVEALSLSVQRLASSSTLANVRRTLPSGANIAGSRPLADATCSHRQRMGLFS